MATADVLHAQNARYTLSDAVKTPDDYANFKFTMPEDTVQKYVGILACQRDPNLRQLETVVTRCSKKVEPAISRSNGKGKAKKSENEEDLWEIELLDTVLFPEGGGQPCDTGYLEILDAEQPTKVLVKEVIRRKLSAIHFCTSSIEVGTRVRAVVDWHRRHDLSTQHTAQHVLSAVLEHHFDLPTLGWALSAYPEVSYIELPRCPTQSELEQTEKLCNELIIEGRRVRVDFDLSDESNRLESLPDDYTGGVTRTVTIDRLDSNPCCGVHYHSLSLLQGIYISRATSPIRSTNTRVYFLAGPRLISTINSSSAILRATSAETSSSVKDIPKRVKLLVGSSREAIRREKALKAELAEFVAGKLLTQLQKTESMHNGVATIAHVREEDSTNDFDFLSLIQGRINDNLPDTPYIVALGHSGNTTPSPDGCLMIFSSSDSLTAAAVAKIKLGESKLTKRLRGGGKGRYQAKVVEGRIRSADEGELLALLRSAVTD